MIILISQIDRLLGALNDRTSDQIKGGVKSPSIFTSEHIGAPERGFYVICGTPYCAVMN